MSANAEITVLSSGQHGYTPRAPLVHRRSAAFAVMLTLASCGAIPPDSGPSDLRDPSAPLGGTTRFDASRFAGDWNTIACLGTCARKVRYVVATDGVYVRETPDEDTPFTIPAPGVLREMGGDQTLVVMWIDEGFRTAAIGDANGRWAAILDRGAGAADRVQAAQEILDFNGWDVSQLRDVKR